MATKQNKILLLVVVLLTIVNLASLLTIIVKVKSIHNATDYRAELNSEADSVAVWPRPRSLMADAGFDEQQQLLLRESVKIHRQRIAPLMEELRNANNALIEEVTSVTPDSTRMDALAMHIGELHGQIKAQTARHMRDLWEISKPGQRETLISFYHRLLKGEQPGPGHREGFRHRRGGGNRYH
ncbi:MAG TPA: hypothetical protein PLV51_12290 [Lentimicrobium sp.]|jgi:hypothetical protein|nr:hypothetical protein [Lentimicrobium sp.]